MMTAKMNNSDRRNVMKTAWRFFRTGLFARFSDALRKAWENVKSVFTAVHAVAEEVHTWSGWKKHERMVAHGSKCLFQVTVVDPTAKTGRKILSYFGLSQTEPLAE